MVISKRADVVEDKVGRVNCLKALDILDSHSEDSFDNLLELASVSLNVKTCWLSFFDENREWIKAKKNLNKDEFNYHDSMSKKIIQGYDFLEFTSDGGFEVAGIENNKYFYALPVQAPNGIIVGALNFLSSTNQVFSVNQKVQISHIAKQVTFLLELRLKSFNKPYESIQKYFNTFGYFQEMNQEKKHDFLDQIIINTRARYLDLSSNKVKLFEYLVNKMIKITNSEIGFFGELVGNKEKKLKIFAVSSANLAKDFETRHTQNFFEINDPETEAIFDQIIDYKKVSFINNPNPSNDNQLNSFASIPLYHKGILVGIIGIGNKKGGYRQMELDSLKDFIKFIAELTNQHLVESGIKQQQEEHRFILENLKVGTWVWDLTNNSLKWDDSNYKVFDLDKKDFNGAYEAWENTLHPDYLIKTTEELEQAVLNQDFFESIFRIKTKDDSLRYIGAKAIIQRDKNGVPLVMRGINYDCTKEFLSEKQHIRQTNFLKDTVDTLPAIFYAKKVTGEFIMINKAFRDLFNLENSDIINKKGHEIFPKEVADLFHENDQAVIAKGGVIESNEIAYGQNGEKRDFHSFKFPYKSSDGKIYATGGISLDITEKKQVEMMLSHSSKLASIGELAAGVGHEINNPLTIIKGYLDNLIKNKETISNDYLEKLKRINNAADRIAKIVTGLRVFARVSDNLEEEVFSPLRICLETIDMLQEIYFRDGLKIIFIHDEFAKDLFIKGDSGKFQQILVNLLSNARDASDQQVESSVKVELKKENQDIIITVKDNGSGIKEEDQSKIFDPFFTTKKVGKGTGIGLSLVHKFVINEFLGNITFESSPEDGTEFTIVIPLTQEKDQSLLLKEQPNKEKLIQKNKGVILLIDDEEDIRSLLSDELSSRGYQVECACNGAEALNILQNHSSSFDLIITDIMMPVLDGYGFLNKLNERKLRGTSKIVLMSGGVLENNTQVSKQTELKIDGFLHKPFNMDELDILLNKAFTKAA